MKSAALAVALLTAVGSVAEARPGGGRSFGYRGSNSYSPPPVTQTAPRQAQPLPGPGYSTPSSGYGAPRAPGSGFGMGGLFRGIAGGFIGAGLFGMLFGHGFMSGVGSFMGLIGFLMQAALVFFLVRLGLNWWRRRQQPAMAGGPQGFARSSTPAWTPAGTPSWGGDRMSASSAGDPAGFAGSGFSASQSAGRAQTSPLTLEAEDFNRFEEMLGHIQTAYGRSDRATLAQLATPEVANRFNAELDENARRGVSNKVTSPKLLQGDLSEAWTEAGQDYATVAMRYQIVDATIDRATGKVIEGDALRPQQVTELWTYLRPHGSGVQGWSLSAIQQT